MLAALSISLGASALGACSSPTDDGSLDVSVIGERFRAPDPDRAVMTEADRVLSSAVMTGLVALDSNGQVEPGLAESWIVTGDGLSTIFRIRPARWRDGSPVTADDVARSLNKAISAESRNPLKPLLSAIDSVVGMTGQVVEIRLKTPRPNLLQLLARPELSIRRNGAGVGTFRIARMTAINARLIAVSSDDELAPAATDKVTLRAERATLATARFMAGKADLVAGGTAANWPVVLAAALRGSRVRFDPVQGLFGLAMVGKSRALANRNLREALAMAIDREALASALDVPNWTTTTTVLPSQLDSALRPSKPDWFDTPLPQRRSEARQRVAALGNVARGSLVVRVALPEGPGMRIVFACLAADWRRIGITAVATPVGDPSADLKFIDAVAPNTSANWYLTQLSCAAGLVCDAAGDANLIASRAADTLSIQSARIADADAATTARASFIPLGAPLRWSLVDPALTGWKENSLAAHPLAELRPPRATGL